MKLSTMRTLSYREIKIFSTRHYREATISGKIGFFGPLKITLPTMVTGSHCWFDPAANR